MPRIQYETKNFGPERLAKIAQANEIIATYQAQGYDLTLRQLYYQFVSRDLIPNKQAEYNKLGSLVSEARRAGRIDWNAIVDRTRNLRSLSHWNKPSGIVAAVAEQFRTDWWREQDNYVEVWFEKDALMGVFERAAEIVRVPFFSCRGYTSDSEVWSAAQRMKRKVKDGKNPVILHFGDHDPSGIDMTRDIGDRIRLFGGRGIEVRRLALNMDQVEQYDPPPNPAKETDSRFANYLAEYGDESWELDALEPTVLAKLVNDEIVTLVSYDQWTLSMEEEKENRRELQAISDNYNSIVAKLDTSETVINEDDYDFGFAEEDE
jgi:hypothetical protein